MTASAQFGHIVWAEVADANGHSKLRTAILVTPSDRITAAGPLARISQMARSFWHGVCADLLENRYW